MSFLQKANPAYLIHWLLRERSSSKMAAQRAWSMFKMVKSESQNSLSTERWARRAYFVRICYQTIVVFHRAPAQVKSNLPCCLYRYLPILPFYRCRAHSKNDNALLLQYAFVAAPYTEAPRASLAFQDQSMYVVVALSKWSLHIIFWLVYRKPFDALPIFLTLA